MTDPAVAPHWFAIEQLFGASLTRPARFRTTSRSPSIVASPALSYPRYSRRRKPETRIDEASCSPVYPTIPHIGSVHLQSTDLIHESPFNLEQVEPAVIMQLDGVVCLLKKV